MVTPLFIGEKIMNNQLKKFKGFMVYLDILGYKEMIYNYNDDEQDKNNVINKLKTLLVSFTDRERYKVLSFMEGLDFDRLYLKAFSDNIVLMYENEELDKLVFLKICSVASYVQGELIKRGFLSRGSICFGDIELNENILFGKTLVDAYLLEEVHNEPTIYLSEELEQLLIKSGVDRAEYLSPFSLFWKDCRDGENEAYLSGIKELVERLNNKTEVSQKTLAKYEWLINEYNSYFTEVPKIKLLVESKYSLKPLGGKCWPEDFNNK